MEDASLVQTKDGIRSGPLESVCLALRKAVRTAEIEKSTGGETGQEDCRSGIGIVASEVGVKTDAKYLLSASALSASLNKKLPSLARKRAI